MTYVYIELIYISLHSQTLLVYGFYRIPFYSFVTWFFI